MSHFGESRDTLQKLIKLLVEKDTSCDANINSQSMSLGKSNKKPEITECSSKMSKKKRNNKTPKKVQLIMIRRAMKAY